MNTRQYLSRINFNQTLHPTLPTLKSLHRRHVFSIPFENLDVHYRRLFNLKPTNVFNKIVNRKRGGFCYEVNSLFNELLRSAGFKTKIISARIITDAGKPGPEYDHMAIVISVNNKQFLADVGFGDLFIEPLEITAGLQHDGRNYFRIDFEDNEYVLYMSPDKIHFQKKYTFTLDETALNLFEQPCYDKQVNPDSHFVINTICTLPTNSGRITIYNDKFTETIGDQKVQRMIVDDRDLRNILKERFGIEV